MRRRMTHLFLGVEACIETGSSMLDARGKASLGSRKAGSLQASITSIDTSIDNLKRSSIGPFLNEFCKIEVRHALKRKKSFYVFFFSNSKSLCNNQLGDYLRKSKKQIFLNNICLTSILQKPSVFNTRED